MVMFTRKVHRKLGGNFTFVVLTDREDLDSQIYKTFAGRGVVDHDRDPCRAAGGEHLSRLLSQHKSHVFSLIQKFNRDPGLDTPWSGWRSTTSTSPSAWNGNSSATITSSPAASAWTRSPGTSSITTRRPGRPVRRCWSASTRSRACACTG